MKLILVCTTMVLLMSSVEMQRSQSRRRKSIAQIYNAANVTIVPDSILGVRFVDVNVTLGMEICPIQTQYLPTIEFDFESGRYYTFVCIDLDWPNPDDPYLSEGLLGLYLNIKGDSGDLTDASCEVARWIGPTPTPCNGLFRYLLYLYEQNGYIDTTDEALQNLQTDRVLFSLSDFASTHNLISPPVAGNMFKAQYPKDCDDSQNQPDC